jgi:hypothetical protein
MGAPWSGQRLVRSQGERAAEMPSRWRERAAEMRPVPHAVVPHAVMAHAGVAHEICRSPSWRDSV